MNKSSSSRPKMEELPLYKAATMLVEECRMVLPGIQALFGFQLIAVFNSTFSEKLSPLEQRLHLLSIALIGIAIVIIMTPAAYHRRTDPEDITQQFINLSTRLLLLSTAPLALSICIDIYLISRLILQNVAFSLLVTFLLLIIFILLWFVLPHSEALRRALSGRE